MDDEVQVGGRHDYWYRTWTDEELLGPLPPPPQFDATIESVRERIVKIIGKVKVPREVTYWHPAISHVLKQDEERRERQRASVYVSSWDEPLFDTSCRPAKASDSECPLHCRWKTSRQTVDGQGRH